MMQVEHANQHLNQKQFGGVYTPPSKEPGVVAAKRTATMIQKKWQNSPETAPGYMHGGHPGSV